MGRRICSIQGHQVLFASDHSAGLHTVSRSSCQGDIRDVFSIRKRCKHFRISNTVPHWRYWLLSPHPTLGRDSHDADWSPCCTAAAAVTTQAWSSRFSPTSRPQPCVNHHAWSKLSESPSPALSLSSSRCRPRCDVMPGGASRTATRGPGGGARGRSRSAVSRSSWPDVDDVIRSRTAGARPKDSTRWQGCCASPAGRAGHHETRWGAVRRAHR